MSAARCAYEQAQHSCHIAWSQHQGFRASCGIKNAAEQHYCLTTAKVAGERMAAEDAETVSEAPRRVGVIKTGRSFILVAQDKNQTVGDAIINLW